MTPRGPRRAGPRELHPVPLTDREALLFEAGIKLGGVFHQYLGTPVAERTARHLAATIAHALRLQPYVVAAEIDIRPSQGGPTGSGAFAYHYLTAEMIIARVTLAQGRTRVTAELAHDPALRYPLMRVVHLTGGGPERRRTRRRVRRSARR